MINIYFFKSKKILKGFKIEGHSNLFKGFGLKIKGFFLKKSKIINSKDYICSAVSAVSYMAVIGLVKVCKKKVSFKTDKSGLMECCLKGEPDRQSSLMLDTLLKTLKEIDKEYPGNIIIKSIEN